MTKNEKFKYICDVVIGSTLPKELKLLMAYASKVPKNGIIIDLGTCGGKSAFALGLGSKPSVRVYTIDVRKHDRFDEHAEKLGLNERVLQLLGGTETHRETWEGKIDLFFHDAVHSYLAVEEDIKMWTPHIDGHIIFHDYKLYSNTVGMAIKDGVKNGHYKKIKSVGNIFIGEVRQN